MRFTVLRTFPVSRNKGFAFLHHVDDWHAWTPVSVGEERDTFRFAPMKGVAFTGRFEILDVVENEAMSVAFEVSGLPRVEMLWLFEHAGPGAFTLRVLVETEPAGTWEQMVETLAMMKPVLRVAVERSLDELERLFLGEPMGEGQGVEEPIPVG